MVVLEYLMLHTKFQGDQPFGSREEDFLKSPQRRIQDII